VIERQCISVKPGVNGNLSILDISQVQMNTSSKRELLNTETGRQKKLNGK
jgi:hypothetical protein